VTTNTTARLERLNKARLDAYLDNPANRRTNQHGKGVYMRQLVQDALYVQTVDRPTHEYNRRKYNRMNHAEQDHYENVTLKKRTIEYRLYLTEDIENDSYLYYRVPKMVYNYAKTILPERPLAEVID
jgi:hypothetical protein